MHREPAILMIIMTERVMEPTLKELVERAGAQGYTIEDVASGWGTHGSRTGPRLGLPTQHPAQPDEAVWDEATVCPVKPPAPLFRPLFRPSRYEQHAPGGRAA